MKTLSISEIQEESSNLNRIAGVRRAVVVFSDGKRYKASIIRDGGEWECSFRLLSSQRTVTSPLRRRMVLKYLGLESAVTRKEKTHVDNLRRGLRKYGYRLQKSNVSKYPHAYNQGGYLVTSCGGVTMLGPCFSATLEQVEAFLAAKAAEFKAEGVR